MRLLSRMPGTRSGEEGRKVGVISITKVQAGSLIPENPIDLERGLAN